MPEVTATVCAAGGSISLEAAGARYAVPAHGLDTIPGICTGREPGIGVLGVYAIPLSAGAGVSSGAGGVVGVGVSIDIIVGGTVAWEVITRLTLFSGLAGTLLWFETTDGCEKAGRPINRKKIVILMPTTKNAIVTGSTFSLQLEFHKAISVSIIIKPPDSSSSTLQVYIYKLWCSAQLI
ncbi:MAG: hypothetical protein NVSMB44_29390 [Ktedonobacteraceae bacterium]